MAVLLAIWTGRRRCVVLMRTTVVEEELGRQWWWTLELFLEGNGAGARRLYRWH